MNTEIEAIHPTENETKRKFDIKSFAAAALTLACVIAVVCLTAFSDMATLKEPMPESDASAVYDEIASGLDNLSVQISEALAKIDSSVNPDDVTPERIREFLDKIDFEKNISGIENIAGILLSGSYSVKDINDIIATVGDTVAMVTDIATSDEYISFYEKYMEPSVTNPSDITAEYDEETLNGIKGAFAAIKYLCLSVFAVWALLGVLGAVLTYFRKAGALKYVFFASSILLSVSAITAIGLFNYLLSNISETVNLFGIVTLSSAQFMLKATFAPFVIIAVSVVCIVANIILLKKPKKV